MESLHHVPRRGYQSLSSALHLAPWGWWCTGQRWRDARTACTGSSLPQHLRQSSWIDPWKKLRNKSLSWTTVTSTRCITWVYYTCSTLCMPQNTLCTNMCKTAIITTTCNRQFILCDAEEVDFTIPFYTHRYHSCCSPQSITFIYELVHWKAFDYSRFRNKNSCPFYIAKMS